MSLPSSEEIDKEYWRDESKQHGLRDGWGGALGKILDTRQGELMKDKR